MSDQDARQAGLRLMDAIRAVAAADPDLDGSVLTGFVLVPEFLRPDGKRMLGYVTRSGDGMTELTDWAASGMVHAAEVHFDARLARSEMGSE